MLHLDPVVPIDLAAAVSDDPVLPDTAFSLARRLGLDPARCRAVLDRLASEGLLERLGPEEAPAYRRLIRGPRGAA